MKEITPRNIAWINGQWGSVNELMIPLQDRGLQLADGVFETILIQNGKTQLLQAHLNRWERSASLLGMAQPPSTSWLIPLIEEAIKRTKEDEANGALRLNWSRGICSGRGIDIPLNTPNHKTHCFWLELNLIKPSFNAISTLISSHEYRNPYSNVSHCKTFGYGQAIQARREAQMAGYNDALLLSTNQELCCGSAANLIIHRGNRWLTPRLASGCLPGIMRQQGLERGIFHEAKLTSMPQEEDEWLLINSLSCHPITKLNNQSLKTISDPQALWQSLIMS